MNWKKIVLRKRDTIANKYLLKCTIPLAIRKMWIKTTSTTCITSARVATTEKTNNTKCCCGCGERGLFLNFGGNAHFGSHCENHCNNNVAKICHSQKRKKKDFLSYHRYICMPIFIAELLTVAKNWNPPSRYCGSSPKLEDHSWY